MHDGKNLFVNEFTLKSSLIMHLSVVILSVKMICGNKPLFAKELAKCFIKEFLVESIIYTK